MSPATTALLAWATLAVAGLLEIGWAVGLKYTDGFSRLVPSVLTVGAMAASVGLLSLALRHIPIGTAYAVWTGIGAVGVAIAGMILFGEPRDGLRILFILLIVAGIAGLKIVS
jgi:quaternary ammonium compound-resistance protein SugE